MKAEKKHQINTDQTINDMDENQEALNNKETKPKAKEKQGGTRKKSSGDSHAKLKNELEDTLYKLAEIQDKYLRLSAEYDNYRKRTLKEKMELVKTGGEQIILNILPVVDNLERALSSIREARDSEALKEGVELIYGKFKEFLAQKGVKEIECLNCEFDTDVHEAITKIPVSEEDKKGKVVDIIERGYYLHDKVVRFAKVVVGE